MTDSSARASCVAALHLQRERSSAYQQWTSLFHRALMGDITPSELQRNIQGIVLPEFQRISLALRTLQKSLMEKSDGSGQDRSATVNTAARAPVSDTAAADPCARESSLATWIDQLQDLEREHYGVTLSLANQLVDHCAPNVLAASSPSSSSSAGDGKPAKEQINGIDAWGSPSEEAVPTDMMALFKPDDSGDDENLACGEVEWREKRAPGPPPPPPPQPLPAPSASAEPANAEARATLCVHDGKRCVLQRLIPPRFHTHLFFVDCKDGVDELAGTTDLLSSAKGVNEDSENSEEEKEAELLPVYAKEHANAVAFYAPTAIAQRCVGWSGSVEPIVRRQEHLRSAIEDLCEDLQSAISDM